MIIWGSGKGGFVGGSKTAIKGAFQFVYSKFVEPPPPDVEGVDSQVCFPGTIKDNSFNGSILSIAFNGAIADQSAFSGAIAEINFNGSIAELEFNGTIQDC
jgi:hypothetical protein